ncbi:enoyl-ACP reductase FabI [Massilia pinisoli]|uniref:Enoyl-[acyl-carrier-protein] reductase [NADH] n=1 Tax=Massilia pinisoli TaxID=1772194 RepID=A0ABT1ZWJ5_9BURK|nr:enoyl-ACP reductase FabI [Massilia pinisoli]
MDLRGKRGLILGIANERSIAYGCARVMAACGAELAVTYLNADAGPHVRPLAEALRCPLVLPCDVREPGQLEAVFDTVGRTWGGIDFVLHAIAYAPTADLHGRVTDCSAAGFALAMDVSCHSFIRCAKLAEPLMLHGGSLLTFTFYGGEKVVPHYNLMGPVKAALEASVRVLAAELGSRRIRVNAVSPGPLGTRAASGLDHFDELLGDAWTRAPEHMLARIDDVGNMAAFLASDAARLVTGNIEFVDAGYHVMG